MNEAIGPTLLQIARAAVEARLGAQPGRTPQAGWLAEPGAVFVTLRRKGGGLHGCIGTIEPEEAIGETVAKHAALAAFDDPRSRPLQRAELDDVRFEVSVLGRPRALSVTSEADAIEKLRPGVDGVILTRRARRALFLPQVWHAVRDGKDFLAKLKVKAGLPASFWDLEIELETFDVQSFAEPGYGEDGVS